MKVSVSMRVCNGIWDLVEVENEWMESKVARHMLGCSEAIPALHKRLGPMLPP